MANSLGDLVVKITGDNKELDKALTDSEKKVQQTEKTVSNLTTAFQNVSVAIGAAVAFATKLVKEWAEVEKISIKLDYALKGNSNAVVGATDRISEYAIKLSQLAGIDDDVIKEQFSVLASFGLTETKMKEVMDAAVNLSSTGLVTLDEAIIALGGSFEGSIGRIGRYVPELKNLTKEQLEAGDAVKYVNEKFKGTAEVIGNSLNGQINKLTVSIGDLKKAMGEALAPIIEPFLKPITELIKSITGTIVKTFELVAAQNAMKDGTATASQKVIALTAALKSNEDQINALNIKQNNLVKSFGEGIMSSKGFKETQNQMLSLQESNSIMKKLLQSAKDEIDAQDKVAKKADEGATKKAKDAQEAKAASEKALADGQAILESYEAEQTKKEETDKSAADSENELNDLIIEGIRNNEEARATYYANQEAFQNLFKSQLEKDIDKINDEKQAWIDAGIDEVSATKWAMGEIEKARKKVSDEDKKNNISASDRRHAALYAQLTEEKKARYDEISDWADYGTDLASIMTATFDLINGLIDASVTEQETALDKELKAAQEELDKEQAAQDHANSLELAAQDKLLSNKQEAEDKAIDDKLNKELDAIDEKMQAELYAAGLVDAETKDQLESELAAALAAGDTETAAEIQKKLDKLNITQKYEDEKAAIEKAAEDAKTVLEQQRYDAKLALDEARYQEQLKADDEKQAAKDALDLKTAKKKAKLEYDAAMIAWEFQVAMAAVNAASAIIKCFTDLGPIAGTIAAAAQAVVDGIQLAAIIAAQPKMPSLAEGGIIPARPGGTVFRGGEGGEAEGIIPLSKLNQMLSRAGGGGGIDSTPINLTIKMDSKVLYSGIFDATRSRNILIDARAVV